MWGRSTNPGCVGTPLGDAASPSSGRASTRDRPGLDRAVLHDASAKGSARARRSSVKTVIIRGEIVYKDGRFVKVDHKNILDQIHQDLSRKDTPEELNRRDTSKNILSIASMVETDLRYQKLFAALQKSKAGQKLNIKDVI